MSQVMYAPVMTHDVHRFPDTERVQHRSQLLQDPIASIPRPLPGRRRFTKPRQIDRDRAPPRRLQA
jgi:hypothetical protein